MPARTRSRAKGATQLELPLNRPASRLGHGGARAGAGRPRRIGRSNTPHQARPKHVARHPVLVTLRAGVGFLRSQRPMKAIERALRRMARLADGDDRRLRVLHYSVQKDHVHAIVEANDKDLLSRGMRGLTVRLARRINQAVGRRGRLWSDRWHGRALSTPREVKRAIAYVLLNFVKHRPREGAPMRQAPWVDLCASGTQCDVAQLFAPALLRPRPPPTGETREGGEMLPERALTENGAARRALGRRSVVPAKAWLAAVGWKRHGLIDTTDLLSVFLSGVPRSLRHHVRIP